MMCRQCPGYRKELSSALWICEPAQSEGPAKVPGDGPSTSSGTSTGHSRSHLSLNHALTHTHQQRNPCPSTCWNPLFSPCSSSGVQVCSSGQSPHLHLLPAAHAWPTLRVPSPSDVPTALWVALTPVHQCSQAYCSHLMICCPLLWTGMVCQKPFCHVYWGCQRIGCHGCLAHFSGRFLSG